MFSVIRKRATYANVVLTLALVFAMTGGAYAAKKYLITSTKQISPKVLKALAGKAGPAGTLGAAGPVGVQGPVGKEGTAGKEGPTGKEGTVGKEGATGKQGLVGKEGPTGKEGPPGPTCNQSGECNLPSGASETGLWSIAGSGLQKSAVAEPLVAISYPLHLTFVPTAKFVTYPESFTAGSVAGCPGTVSEPKAEAGNLCVYAFGGGLKLFGIVQSAPVVDGKSGALLDFEFENEPPATEAAMYGSWAVKAS